jgi:hypothetical protein
VLSAFGIVNDIKAGYTGCPFVGRHDTREHAERGCLPGTIGADQAKDLSGMHIKAQVIDCEYAWKAFGESLGDDGGLGWLGHYLLLLRLSFLWMRM